MRMWGHTPTLPSALRMNFLQLDKSMYQGGGPRHRRAGLTRPGLPENAGMRKAE